MKVVYDSIRSTQHVLQASFSFFALELLLLTSIALSSNLCHFAEWLKNLEISPIHDSAFLNAEMVQEETITKFSR